MPGFVCIHGHFYQPPRDDPWRDAVPRQPSAAPFHDWNARIHAECYAPNTAARVVDPRGRILRVVDNYSWISFDFGPTLLRWLDRHHPETHAAIVAADRAAVGRWGAGVAMAQAYNHAILPLCSPRDLRTQVRWGLADFRHRFGRDADGMWLPECAVDVPTLEALAAAGVRFTVLAPQQIEGVRDPSGSWHATPHGPDPRRPYRVELPSGRAIAVFVYNGPLSQGVAFERLLDRGDALYERLRNSAPDDGQLAHIATDGESYGHHHRHGEMALAWAIVRGRDEGRLLPYAPFLHRHPPTWTALIREPSSWSCAHGVERWRSDCGCHTGGPEHWNQRWRGPLRDALDHLRDTLDALWAPEATTFLRDPWAARDAWIDVLLDPGQLGAWLDAHAVGPLDDGARVRVRELMEIQHQRQLMYTSCAWFFDDLAGIEPVQNLAYARRAIDLAARLWPDRDLLTPFRVELARARTNDPREGTGADLLDRRVEPLRIDGVHAAAHHALVSRFAPGPAWHGHDVEIVEDCGLDLPDGALLLARVVVTERATGRRTAAITASLIGTRRCWGAARPDTGESLDALVDDLSVAPAARVHATWPAVVDGPDRLRPADRATVEAAAVRALEAQADALAATWRRLAAVLPDPGPDLPDVLAFGARASARARLRAALTSAEPTPDDLPEMASELQDPASLAEAARVGLAALVQALSADDPGTLRALVHRVRVLRRIGVTPPLWDLENRVLELLGDPATRTAAWAVARREVEVALHLAVG